MLIDTLFNKKDQVIFQWCGDVRHGTVGGIEASLRFSEARSARTIRYAVNTPDEFSNKEVYMVEEAHLFADNESNVSMLRERIIEHVS